MWAVIYCSGFPWFFPILFFHFQFQFILLSKVTYKGGRIQSKHIPDQLTVKAISQETNSGFLVVLRFILTTHCKVTLTHLHHSPYNPFLFSLPLLQPNLYPDFMSDSHTSRETCSLCPARLVTLVALDLWSLGNVSSTDRVCAGCNSHKPDPMEDSLHLLTCWSSLSQ